MPEEASTLAYSSLPSSLQLGPGLLLLNCFRGGWVQNSGVGTSHGDGGDIYNVRSAEILANEALVSPLVSTLLYSCQLNTGPNLVCLISASSHQWGRPNIWEAARHFPHGCQYTFSWILSLLLIVYAKILTHYSMPRPNTGSSMSKPTWPPTTTKPPSRFSADAYWTAFTLVYGPCSTHSHNINLAHTFKWSSWVGVHEFPLFCLHIESLILVGCL